MLEHLPDTLGVMEELHRIGRDRCRIRIVVPYWNSMHSVRDPTHVRAFTRQSFDYYDPSKPLCRRRPYYTKARFGIVSMNYFTHLGPWTRGFDNSVVKKVLEGLAEYFCNVIDLMEVTLEVQK